MCGFGGRPFDLGTVKQHPRPHEINVFQFVKEGIRLVKPATNTSFLIADKGPRLQTPIAYRLKS